MEEALTQKLLGTGGVTAVVGDRLFWGVRKQGSGYPSIVLTKIDGAQVYSDEGEAGLGEARIQADCWCADSDGVDGYAAAKGVARALRTALSGASFTEDGVEFQAAFLDREQDSSESGQGGEVLHRVSLDFIIWHNA